MPTIYDPTREHHLKPVGNEEGKPQNSLDDIHDLSAAQFGDRFAREVGAVTGLNPEHLRSMEVELAAKDIQLEPANKKEPAAERGEQEVLEERASERSREREVRKTDAAELKQRDENQSARRPVPELDATPHDYGRSQGTFVAIREEYLAAVTQVPPREVPPVKVEAVKLPEPQQQPEAQHGPQRRH